MFVGHYGVSFAGARATPRLPLWAWFIFTQWLDVVWSVLVLLGIERLRVIPGFTEANPLDLYYMPYTHSLPGAIVLSLILGAVVALCVSERRGRVFALAAAGSFSHWLLDLVVHVPDMPLYDDSAKVGFGLWRHVAVSFPLELLVLGVGAWLYVRAGMVANAAARRLLWIFLILLVFSQAYSNFGPLPPSPKGTALIVLGSYVLFAVCAAVVESARSESAKTAAAAI